MMTSTRRRWTWNSIAVTIAAWLGYFFLMLPTFIVVPMSFGNKYELAFPPTSFSTYLYEQFLFQSNWVEATIRSFQVAAASTCFALLLGVPAAYSMARAQYPGKRYLMMLLVSPILVPVIVVALGLYFYFARIRLSGSLLGLILAHTVYILPFIVVTCVAGMRHVDPVLERAARVMGAGPIYIFFRIVLPILRPSAVAGGLFAFLLSFDEVVIAYFISSAGSMTLPVKMFSSLRWELSPVLAAVSTLLTILSLVMCIANAVLQKQDQR